jgi:hypothetical protein
MMGPTLKFFSTFTFPLCSVFGVMTLHTIRICWRELKLFHWWTCPNPIGEIWDLPRTLTLHHTWILLCHLNVWRSCAMIFTSHNR